MVVAVLAALGSREIHKSAVHHGLLHGFVILGVLAGEAPVVRHKAVVPRLPCRVDEDRFFRRPDRLVLVPAEVFHEEHDRLPVHVPDPRDAGVKVAVRAVRMVLGHPGFSPAPDRILHLVTAHAGDLGEILHGDLVGGEPHDHQNRHRKQGDPLLASEKPGLGLSRSLRFFLHDSRPPVVACSLSCFFTQPAPARGCLSSSRAARAVTRAAATLAPKKFLSSGSPGSVRGRP